MGPARAHLPRAHPLPIGCLNQCTYCKTKHARGDLGSYPVQEIVDRVRAVIAGVRSKDFGDLKRLRTGLIGWVGIDGVVEIWLTSEDTGAYGRDLGTTIPELLHAILDVGAATCCTMLRSQQVLSTGVA
jgi:threonylcarbamoyladenosine tRNA methylthiotransferase CDKAL1